MDRWDSFSVTNASQSEAEAHLHQTEHPIALPASWRCPGQPGALWEVGQPGALWEVVSLATPGSPSVMDATDPAMWAGFIPETGREVNRSPLPPHRSGAFTSTSDDPPDGSPKRFGVRAGGGRNVTLRLLGDQRATFAFHSKHPMPRSGGATSWRDGGKASNTRLVFAATSRNQELVRTWAGSVEWVPQAGHCPASARASAGGLCADGEGR